MQSLIIIGVIILTGFIFGEIVSKLRLPKVIGYILAGVLLNPQICHFMPKNLNEHTGLATNIALSFITFSIGGTIFYPKLKELGKSILCITVFEAEFAFLALIVGLAAVIPIFVHIPNATFLATFLPMALLIGCLGAPTDPSIAMAIKLQYNPKGEVSSTMLSVAAFDDVLGIMNYSVAVVIAQILVMHQSFSAYSSFVHPVLIIAGSFLLGTIFGIVFNVVTKFIDKETEGVFIVVILGLLTLCFGIAGVIGVDELLSIMTMGIVVVNFNEKREGIFKVLERYIDELVFVLFFTLSGMQLDFSVLSKSYMLIIFFAIFRTIGKFSGAATGAFVAKSSSAVKKYTGGGLIPLGGIVIGLALMIKQNPAFSSMSDIIISVIVGSTIIHELIGPIFVKLCLRKAGEINDD